MTARDKFLSKTFEAVENLERLVKATDEKGLESLADKTSKEDMSTVNESVPVGKADLKDCGDQNAKANKNWALSESAKNKVAARLIALAKDIMEDVEK